MNYDLLDDIITELHCKIIILGGDFYIFYNILYETRGGNPKMKNKSVAKFTHTKKTLGLRDIWRARNPKKNRYTFRQPYVIGFI